MWHRSILETVRQERDRGLCLYGAGFWGKIGFDIFKKLGVTPLCFCDDDTEKQGENYCEIPVYSLKKAVELYPNVILSFCYTRISARHCILIPQYSLFYHNQILLLIFSSMQYWQIA